MNSPSQNAILGRVTWKHKAEFAAVRILVAIIGSLPRSVAYATGAGIGVLAYQLAKRLRDVGLRNLELAYPRETIAWRTRILRRVYRNLGYQLAEFCQMPQYTREQADRWIEYDGLDHYLAAHRRGKGVLVLTGHLGAWELSSFYHSLVGHPMGLVIRRLDNPLVDNFVNRIRCLHGNRVIHKDDFARGLISAMHRGQTVGILMDTNMTPPQGVFVPFFNHLACTASGLAKVALKTDAAVLPGFLLRDAATKRYRLTFGSPIELLRTGNTDMDVLANTAAFTAVIERYIRQSPDQWLWMHRRWKTRPPGEEGIY